MREQHDTLKRENEEWKATANARAANCATLEAENEMLRERVKMLAVANNNSNDAAMRESKRHCARIAALEKVLRRVTGSCPCALCSSARDYLEGEKERKA